MPEQRKSFGHMDPSIAARPAPKGAASGGQAAPVDYAWLTQPLREGAAEDAAQHRGLLDQLNHLVTESPFRRWIWIGAGVVVFGLVQVALVDAVLDRPLPKGGGAEDPGVEPAAEPAVSIRNMAIKGNGASASDLRIGGLLVNDGDLAVTGVTLRIALDDCAGDPELGDCTLAHEAEVEVPLDVPAGGSSGFELVFDISGMEPMRGTGSISYAILDIETE